jgi:hypothetical protein
MADWSLWPGFSRLANLLSLLLLIGIAHLMYLKVQLGQVLLVVGLKLLQILIIPAELEKVLCWITLSFQLTFGSLLLSLQISMDLGLHISGYASTWTNKLVCKPIGDLKLRCLFRGFWGL